MHKQTEQEHLLLPISRQMRFSHFQESRVHHTFLGKTNAIISNVLSLLSLSQHDGMGHPFDQFSHLSWLCPFPVSCDPQHPSWQGSMRSWKLLGSIWAPLCNNYKHWFIENPVITTTFIKNPSYKPLQRKLILPQQNHDKVWDVCCTAVWVFFDYLYHVTSSFVHWVFAAYVT